jgi:hypothetical protein
MGDLTEFWYSVAEVGQSGWPWQQTTQFKDERRWHKRNSASGNGKCFLAWRTAWESRSGPSSKRMCGSMRWSWPDTRWDEPSLSRLQSDWPWPGQSVSQGRSPVRLAVACVRLSMGTGHWRRPTGRLNFTNRSAIARPVAGIFFPQRPALGLDQRSYSPAVLDKIVSANAEHKSAGKAQKMLRKLAEISVSIPAIMELSGMIGQELYEHLEQQAAANAQHTLQPQYAELPRVVCLAMDGGRIMTRAEAGRGVHDWAWKETKNACLLTMSSSTSATDPHPELPTCFRDPSYVEQLVREMHASASCTSQKSGEIPAISGETEVRSSPPREPSDTAPTAGRSKEKWQPERLVRTCVSSMMCSDEFGPLVAGEAQRRGFYQASRRAFLGDGQAWNWTLHAVHFPDFVPILDFVHPLGYVYDAAKILAPADPWPLYLRATTSCWQGQVANFLDELHAWQAAHPTSRDETLADDDPRSVIQTTVTYLENNRTRMDYPTYRRQGLPISTYMIESLIKEINYRVKGTEKFWNRPAGAEQILQIRAAALCDDDRLSQWILNRPGAYFYRVSTSKDACLATPA